jgi:hypothetical protein
LGFVPNVILPNIILPKGVLPIDIVLYVCMVLRFFSEFQVAECQNFDRHFTENGPNTRISKRQMFDRPKVRQVTLPNRQLFELPIFECTIFSKKIYSDFQQELFYRHWT